MTDMPAGQAHLAGRLMSVRARWPCPVLASQRGCQDGGTAPKQEPMMKPRRPPTADQRRDRLGSRQRRA